MSNLIKMNFQEKITKVKSLINEINGVEYFSKEEDIRNVTHYLLYQNTENFLFGLLQSENFFKLDNFRAHIDSEFNSDDVEIKKWNYDGFLKDAFFIKNFVSIESYIRHIASFYESLRGGINDLALKKTFKNLTNQNKTDLFTSLNTQDENVFNFFCYLRNTMHNIGFQSDNNQNQTLIIHDLNSQIETNQTELLLETGKPNNINLNKLLLLNEQIFKLMTKINSLIPQTDFIKHKLVETGFNN